MSDKIYTWDELREEVDKWQSMSCRPDFRKVPGNYIFDEDKSVKWNREQVEQNHRAYDEAVKALNRLKNEAGNAFHNHVYDKICDEVGHDLTREKAIKIYDYAYRESHAYGFSEIQSTLQELCELVSDILD